jgi:ATP-binding cassette subfamily B protein/subfamily B ATP-binding cassette protein MsbA
VTDKTEKKDKDRSPGTIRILSPFIRQERLALFVAALATVALVIAELAAPWPLKFAICHLTPCGTNGSQAEQRAVDTGGSGGGVRLERGSGGQPVLVVPQPGARLQRGSEKPTELVAGDYAVSQGGEQRDISFGFLAFLGGLVLAIALFGALAAYQSDLRLLVAGERIIHELRLAIYAQLQRLRISFHHRTPTGDLVTRVTADVDAIGDAFANSLGKFVAAFLLLAGYLIVTVVFDPVMALVSFSVAPFLALFSSWFRRRQREASKKQRGREGEVASMSGEVLAAMREVQAFGSEEYEQDRLRVKSEERQRAGIVSAKIEARFTGVIDVTGAVAVAFALAVGVWRVTGGHLSIGDLAVVVAYAGRLYRPLSIMAKHGSRISKALARGDRIAEVLATDEVLEERPNAYQGSRATGEIQFDHVTFGYTPERVSLHEVSFLVPAGQRVAIIGRSGAGKSTVAALVARFYDPQEGRVMIDDRDVRDCSLRWLRTQVGLVLQESVLFTGTVAENIAYGIKDADPEAVVEAAKAAGAHDFISQMPDGYDAMLGQRGVGVSGGQRQRIAIARMILRNPSILVLDEPTTGLDVQSEAEVMKGLEELMRGRTTVMITHSPALTRTAHRVIEIDDGRIARQGSPVELAAELRSIRRAEAAEAAAAGRVAPPPDSAIPQLERLLDPEVMAPVLRRSLGWEAPPLEIRVHYLRYRPQRTLVVHYDVRLDGTRHDAVAVAAPDRDLTRWVVEPTYRRLADMANGRAPARDPLSYAPEVAAMIQWLPLDISMPALAYEPTQLRLRLQAAGVDIPATGEDGGLLAYEPRRRATLRLDGHVLKIYAEEREFAMAVAGLELAGRLNGVRTPKGEGALDELRLTCEGLLSGNEADPLRDAAAAGSVLAALHASEIDGLRGFSATDQLRAAAIAADSVTAVVPELDERLQALLRTLELTRPDVEGLVPAHGNFHARQLIRDGGMLGVTDFDAMCSAPAAIDLAAYAARLVTGDEKDDLSATATALEGLVEGYGGRPRGLSWYLATSIVLRSPDPFHFLEPHWPVRIERMIGAAEDALHL